MSRLFDDKPRSYTKPALRAETAYSFLDRTSRPEFERVRDMLERWVERLPDKQQRDVVGRMRHKGLGSQQDETQFNAAMFELFLYEFLLGTGARVVAAPIIDGLTPDFAVTERVTDGSQLNYVVEAKDIDLELGTKIRGNWNELRALDAIDAIKSGDFRLYIRVEGRLEYSLRGDHMRAPFEKLLKETEYDELLSQVQHGLHFEHFPSASFSWDGWKVIGHLTPVSPEWRGKTERFVAGTAWGADSIDDIGKTKNSLYGKAKRYKNVENLIIALRCDMSNNRLDEVLFGSQQFTFNSRRDITNTAPLPEPYSSQRLNGFWFNSSGPIYQNVIGVVAFYGVHPHAVDRSSAVFYSNPYLEKPMPEWTKLITHAEYEDGNVSVVEGVAPCSYLRDYEIIGNPFTK